MKHMIPNVSDIDNIWNWSRVWQYVFVLCSACNYETWLGESRFTASDFNKGKYLDLIKLKVYQPCVQSCAWNQRRKKRTFTTFTNLGYKSFGKKFLRKNFHEKAKNLFGKHSVEKFPWKIKQKFLCRNILLKNKDFGTKFLRKNLYEKITLPGGKT